MLSKNKFITFVFLSFLFTIALFYRLYGIFAVNPPFWVDEFYTSSQAVLVLKYGLSVFTNPNIYFEYHNIIPHFLVALFFKFFGQHEFAARLPFVLIGSLVPVVVFILTKKIADLKTALLASLLTVFSYMQIVWSRQARGYVLQQLLVLITFYLYLKIISSKKVFIIYYLLFIIFLILGVLTHVMFYLVIASFVTHYLFFNLKTIFDELKKPRIYFVGFGLILLMFVTGFANQFFNFYKQGAILTNNLWYYHSFLWREYGLITFLAAIGFVLGFLQKRKNFVLILIYTLVHLIFVSFIFKPYISRYLLPIFPILLIAFSYSLTQITTLITKNKNYQIIISLILAFSIILNGYKFVNKPKKYYSVDHDFREISNIDYYNIYGLIKQKLNNKKTAIIDTLPDRAGWFLGYDYEPWYLLRWGNEEGFVNGLGKKTPFEISPLGEKVVLGTDLNLVTDLADLKKVIQKYSQGFIFIDDTSLSLEIQSYAQTNLKKEIYLDHYPLDDNPYSIWPATLYSWGFN